MSVYGEDIHSSELQFGAQQIRIHNSNRTKFSIFVSTRMIIESSSELEISEWREESLLTHFPGKKNEWENVSDFNWIKSEPSPNYKLV